MRDLGVRRLVGFTTALLLTLAGCGREPEPNWRFALPDVQFTAVDTLVGITPGLERIAEIDHARLAADAGSPMPPARVVLFSDPALDADLLAIDRLVGVDLPFRVLAYASPEPSGDGSVAFSRFDAIAARHGLADHADLAERWNTRLDEVLAPIEPTSRHPMPAPTDVDRGIITLDSPFDFTETRRRLMDAITAQSDTIVFTELDFAARSREHGADLPPTVLILFGAPAPGGRCMQDEPRLGLDAFCQKLLVWEDDDGVTHASFNDLLVLAERQDLDANLALGHVNGRIGDTLAGSLEAGD